MTSGQPTQTRRRVEFVGVDDWNRATDAIMAGGSVADDPRCLFGWGCADHSFGHFCDRPVGHPGKCMENVDHRLPCESKQRPSNWDDYLRQEYNR